MEEPRGVQVRTAAEIASGDYRSALRELLEPDALFDRLISELLLLIPSADGALVGLVGEGGLIRFVEAAGSLHGLVGSTLDPVHSLAGLAIRTGTVLRCDDVDTDPRVDAEMLRQVEMTSLVSVPLQHGGASIGVVNIVARRPYAFSDDDILRCTLLADFLASIICSSAEIAHVLDALAASDTDAAAVLGGTTSPAAVARFVSNVLSPSTTQLVDVRQRIRRTLDEHRFTVVYQPIVRLSDSRLVAVEALARFVGPPDEPPDRWFAAAAACGLGVDLELAAFAAALDALPHLPGHLRLCVNIGPAALATTTLKAILDAADARRVVVELTEHVPIDDYGHLQAVVSSLRYLGARLSVDDTGAGYASLTHIVKLAPEFIKLDRWIVSGVSTDPVRRALVVALVGFAHEIGARVVGEGIETAAEFEALASLGVDFGQGFLLARPGTLEDALAFDHRVDHSV